MRRIVSAIAVLQALSGVTTTVTGYYTNDFEPNPSFRDIDAEDLENVKRGFLSSTLGSNMVLQRDRPATIWGFSAPGAAVTTTFEGQTLSATVGADGVWRQRLPPRPASLRPTSIHVSATTGESADLTNVLFGDVYLCGGQSNMQFAVPGVTNATAEAAAADRYPHIRLFTVGTDTSSAVALDDLQTIWQPWAVAGAQSVAPGKDAFHVFSAVCWFFGRTVADGLGNEVPVGLVSDNWGGTPVEAWSTRDALDECRGGDRPQGNLYNAMIHPYTVGPMAIAGFTWYQGEANTRDQQSADAYACLFPAMIRAWRKVMEVPDAFFGFVQLSTWCPDPSLGVPEMREAQMAALNLPGKIGYSTNADYGAGCNIHPPFKQPCGKRLGRSALALNYDNDVAWRSPSYSEARAKMMPSNGGTPAKATVVVRLADVSSVGLYVRDPYNRNTLDCTAQVPGTCAWASIRLSVDGWVNATATISGGQMVLVASTEKGSQNILGSSYGWGSVPMLSVYDSGTDLPVLPWNNSIGTAAHGDKSAKKGMRGKDEEVEKSS